MAVERKVEEVRSLNDEIKALRAKLASAHARDLAESAVNGAVVTRIDGLGAGELRDLAIAVRAVSGIRAVVLGGVTDTGGVSLVAATASSVAVPAGSLIAAAAKVVGGGGGGKGDIATAGGKFPEHLDEAIRLADAAVHEALSA